MSSGGYSFEVKTAHKTATRKATAPIWKEYLIVSGMPLGVLPVTPK